jgi:hypothetical protein
MVTLSTEFATIAEDAEMSAVASNPRQILKRAADEAPEPVVRALADAWEASKEGADERMVVIRFRRDGRASTEVFTPNRKDADSAQPITLLDALHANEDLYQDALHRGRDAQRELLAAEGGVLTGAQVADLLGLSRQAVDKRRRVGRLIGLSTSRRGIVYPAWQFTESGVLPGLEDVLSDLPIRTGWSTVLFMLQANAWVDDEMPIHVLRRGEVDRVRRAAKMYLEHGAP